MLECGSRPVERDELLNVFWWDDMPANAVAMLHNMIYHLRRELGAYGLENIILYKNKTYTLDMSLIAAEDSEILAVCRAAEDKNTDVLTEHTARLKTYWGAYLGNIDSPWANERREYYDRCYIDACTCAARQLSAEAKHDAAAVLLKNAHHLDPYSEALVSELLSCYTALGKPDKARLCYEEYAALLEAEFGTRPASWLRKQYFSCLSDNGDG